MSILELILLGSVLLLIVYYVLNNREVIKLIRKNDSTMVSFRNVNSNTLLNKYMFKNDNKMNKSSKKKIFIHIPTERNERNWSSFGSRSSTDMNMDIAMLCIESTIRHLENDADIRHIQKLLGHSSISTTEIYTKVAKSLKKSVLDTYHPLKNKL